MAWISTKLSYSQTGYFSEIITDYLKGSESLSPFYLHPPSRDGLMASLRNRRQFPVKRDLLVACLNDQYRGVDMPPIVEKNIRDLSTEHVFTVCTAHQPALFTGPLYFIYKILHAIRLADSLNLQQTGSRFVPVFYMGSEDADLDELNHFFLDNEKIIWDTHQTGAVGRMRPEGLEPVISRIEGEFGVQPFGPELCAMIRECYLDSPDIQTATFKLIHRLFGEYGLIVLIADRPELKRQMIPVFEADLFSGTVSAIVDHTIDRLSEHYKVQANPRAINLFYLKDELREELNRHPERFSPNVILRGLFQETILPNIAFIGGGGEIAYWLEYKDLFVHFGIPYPALIVRNSFLLIENAVREKMEKAGLSGADLFCSEEKLINDWVRRQSKQQLSLETEIAEAGAYYDRLKRISAAVDPTLVQHVEALQARAVEPVRELEKKLLKAEKRKFKDQQNQINLIRSALFPQQGLQERVASFLPWFAARGRSFIKDLYTHSLSLEQEFTVLEETRDQIGV